jgi:2-methylisocitrate lyase-like PEP mutase family enzyme
MTTTTSQSEKADTLRALHVPGTPLLMPNAWDEGSARLFAAIGCAAIATTSGGFAVTRGRLDGAMTRDEVLAHSGDLTRAVDIPVSADLEDCFAAEPEGVAVTIAAAIAAGLAGGRSRTSPATATTRSTNLATRRSASVLRPRPHTRGR